MDASIVHEHGRGRLETNAFDMITYTYFFKKSNALPLFKFYFMAGRLRTLIVKNVIINIGLAMLLRPASYMAPVWFQHWQ